MHDRKVALKELFGDCRYPVVAFSGIMAETAMNVTFTVLSQNLIATSVNLTTLYLLAVTITITTN